MATRKRRDDGDDNGSDNGADNGGLLDFDDFVDKLRSEIGGLQAAGTCTEPDREGRTFGKRLGKIALEPLDTLDDRIEAEWPGPRTIIIRTRKADGSFAPFVGRLPLAAPRASSAQHAQHAPSDGVQALAEIVKQQQAQIAELVKAARTPPSNETPKLNEQVGALGALASVFQTLKPAESTARAPSFDDWKQAYEMGKKDGAVGGAVASGLAEKALDTFKESGNKLIEAIGGMVVMKAAERSTANDERDAIATERLLAAKRALKEEDAKKDEGES
jgi:hypothetical protein